MTIALTRPVARTAHRSHFADPRFAARDARRTVLARLRDRGLTEAAAPAIREKADAALLIVSELVTNACRHASGPSEMRTSWDGQELTVEIDDGVAEGPVIRPESQRGETGGFGMGLVDCLADGWGVCRRPDAEEGKTVYVRICFPPGDG